MKAMNIFCNKIALEKFHNQNIKQKFLINLWYLCSFYFLFWKDFVKIFSAWGLPIHNRFALTPFTHLADKFC